MEPTKTNPFPVLGGLMAAEASKDGLVCFSFRQIHTPNKKGPDFRALSFADLESPNGSSTRPDRNPTFGTKEHTNKHTHK